ncbi:hypothetical protein BN2497_5779 [Janthinobacterium sp. CG23_2]|nr:hypothetical protein BN2497_5779 [Janthinobacterium sp. CG23_2]CUU29287.1 hypothetical protein BN3177_5779 [Janthinobacterium sp. CG23_2]
MGRPASKWPYLVENTEENPGVVHRSVPAKETLNFRRSRCEF